MDIDDERETLISVPAEEPEPEKERKRKKKKVKKMAVLETPTMLATGGGSEGMGLGGGIGGGLLGGILAGALFGGGIGNNRNNGEGCVTPSNLTAGLTGVTDAIQNTTVMQSLGDIKASVPLAEAQVQLALAGAQGAIVNQVNMGTMATINGQALINKNVSDAIAASLASQTSIKESVAAYGVANLNATKDAQFAIATIVKDDGEKTRALITSNTISELQRQLTVAQTAALEDRLTNRARETEITITNTNTATAQQVQTQAQMQAQSQAIIQLSGLINNLAGDIQSVRQGQVVFNSGTMAGSATQAAANTKVA